MAGPVVQKTWTITANNTITYVSLTDTMGNLLKGVLDFLLAHGYSLKGSSDATTADMSGGNYWSTAADASHRGGTTATRGFCSGPGRALLTAPYTARSALDRAALLALARDWIRRQRGIRS